LNYDFDSDSDGKLVCLCNDGDVAKNLGEWGPSKREDNKVFRPLGILLLVTCQVSDAIIGSHFFGCIIIWEKVYPLVN
jgi:hypothetical protein